MTFNPTPTDRRADADGKNSSIQDDKEDLTMVRTDAAKAELPENPLAAEQLDPQEERRLLLKLDCCIAPVAMILYLIAFLDRSNIGNASVGGMTKDLNFPANGLSVATSVFYVTYVLLETPATIMLRSFRPSRMIPAVVIVWGAVCLANGFARNYATVIGLRLVLGACEAALSPCLVLYLTTFYRRTELPLRLCYLYISAALSGCIGALIATGLMKMDGIRGLAGWQWLYIVEGALTIVIGLMALWLLADTYHDARYLNERQKHLMKVREAQEAAWSRDDGFSMAEIKKALCDPIIWLSGLGQLGVDVCLYAYSTFLVTIVSLLGFDTVASQGVTAPIYFYCALVYLAGALVAMKYHIRYKVILPAAIVTIVGYIVLLVPASNGVHLLGCFLSGTGIYIGMGLHVTWLGENIAGYRKRSTSVGLQQTIGNCGGIIAGQIYRTTDRPRYILGHSASLGFYTLFIVVITIEYCVWGSRNHHRDNMTEDEKMEMDDRGITGDHHWSYRYSR